MELTPEERALVESYLHTSSERNRKWLFVLAVGAVICLCALLLLALATASVQRPVSLLALVLGLVVIARALDGRKRTILARIIQKYDRAIRSDEGAQESTAGP